MSAALAHDFEPTFEPTCVVADDSRRLPDGWPEASAPPFTDPLVERLATLLCANPLARTGPGSPASLLIAALRMGLLRASSEVLALEATALPTDSTALGLDSVRFLRPTADRLRDLQVALSLNKSQLAAALRVSRPTLYQWLDGQEPSADKAPRVDLLCRLISEAGVSGSRPLNGRFVDRPLRPGEPSLLDRLLEDDLNERLVARTLEAARDLTRAHAAARHEREERFRRLGYVEMTEQQKREALLDDEPWRDFSED